MGSQGQGPLTVGSMGMLRWARWGAHPKEQASLVFGYLCVSRRPGKLAPEPGNDAI